MPGGRRTSETAGIARSSRPRRLDGIRRLLSASLCAATLCAATLALLLPAPAGAVEDGARELIRDVIERQLNAFRSDDGAGAYALASPAIRQMFPSADSFMDMVRQGYRPVYRPRGHTFGETRDVDAGLEQTVRIDDADGVGWTAIYTLERQPDGSWAIAGCRLVRAPDQSV